MSILRDLDPNYGKSNVDNQRSASRWKAITLTMGVASIALVSWIAGKNLDAKILDDTPAPSTMPAAMAVKPNAEVRIEDASNHAKSKGAVIDESKTATTTLADNLSPSPQQSSISTSDAVHHDNSHQGVRNAKVTAAKPNKSLAQKSEKIEKPQSRNNKSLADRDVAIISSLVK